MEIQRSLFEISTVRGDGMSCSVFQRSAKLNLKQRRKLKLLQNWYRIVWDIQTGQGYFYFSLCNDLVGQLKIPKDHIRQYKHHIETFDVSNGFYVLRKISDISICYLLQLYIRRDKLVIVPTWNIIRQMSRYSTKAYDVVVHVQEWWGVGLGCVVWASGTCVEDKLSARREWIGQVCASAWYNGGVAGGLDVPT